MLYRPHIHSCNSSSLSSAGKDGKYRHQDQAVFPQGPHYCHKLLCASDKASGGSSHFLSHTVILKSHFCPGYVRPTSPTPEPSQNKLEKQKNLQFVNSDEPLLFKFLQFTGVKMHVVQPNPPSYPKQPIIMDLTKLIIFYCHHFKSNSFYVLIEKTTKQHIINPCRASQFSRQNVFFCCSIQCVIHIAQAH